LAENEWGYLSVQEGRDLKGEAEKWTLIFDQGLLLEQLVEGNWANLHFTHSPKSILNSFHEKLGHQNCKN